MKPEWLEENEGDARSFANARKCFDCAHRGLSHHWTKHRGKGRYVVRECAIHPKCFNTKFSVACKDWVLLGS